MKWLSIRNPVLIEDIEKLERQLQIELPKDYKEIIGPINGGALVDSYIEIPSIGKIPYGRNISLVETANGNIYNLFGWIMNERRYFPFASVGNGDYFCFDLEENQVILWMHEKNEIIYICKTFSDLMQMIQKNTEDKAVNTI